MPYEIKKKDIREMILLMKKLEAKTFNEDDREELSKLSSKFLFMTRAISYTDGYTLIK